MKIEWNKKTRSLVLVYGITAALILILFLAVPFHKDGNSWTAMVFSLISITVSCGLTLYAFSGKKELTSRFYGFPIAKMGWIYASVQILLSLVVIIVSIFIPIPSWMIWVLSVVLAGLTAIGSIAADNARDMVEKVDKTTKSETRKARYFTANMTGISESCKDPALKKSIDKLAENFRFSDPVSSEATEEIEESIKKLIDDLRLEVQEEKNDSAKDHTVQLQNMLSERNRICKLSK